MKKFWIIVIILFSALNVYSQNEYIFLFDNSGSMSGYYRESNSAFKIFCKSLIKNSVKSEDYANVYLFTKTDSKRGIASPKKIFEGKGKDLIAEQITGKMTLMRGNDNGFGTTDLIEALEKSISEIRSDEAIIWLITDNINDNSGSGDSSYLNTLEFYKRLRTDDYIRKILLYPIPEKVTEAGYTSNGYVVYGIVYSKKQLQQKELENYDATLRSAGIKQKPITLKPQDIGTIILLPKITQSRITPAKLYYDGKVLRGFDFEEGERIKETFNELSLKSNLYPYIIKSAKLSVRMDDFVSSDYTLKSLGTQTITPSTVSNVSPEGEVKGFSVMFDMPEISPKFSLNTIFKEDFTVGGNLILEVSNVDIVADENYLNSFQSLFALQTIPEIFKPALKDKKIVTTIPLEIRIKYGSWRLFTLIGILLLLATLIVVPLIILLKKKCYTIAINTVNEQSYCLTKFSKIALYSDDGENLGVLRRSLSGVVSITCSKFTTTPRRIINLIEGIPVNIETETEGYKKNTYSIILKKSNIASDSDTSEISKYH